MHYFKRNIGDYHKKAGRLSMLEHGAYTLLIDACYDREKFPTREDALDWCWARSDQEIAAVDFVLSKFFVLVDGKYMQTRIQEEIELYHSKANKNKEIAIAREAARKEARQRNEHEPCTNEHESPPNHKPLTTNQEPVTNNKTSTSESPTSDPVDPVFNCPHKAIIEIYHRCLPELPRVLDTTWKGSSREKELHARWRHDKRHQSLDFWEAYFEGVSRSKFHLGENDRQWKADLGWLIKRANFDKMVEKIQGGLI